MLTDNGKQFTGRFGGPKAVERVCRENGIRLLHTRPRTPTTTGKIERFYQTVRRELLDDALPFASMDAVQGAVDAFAEHYTTARPHQASSSWTANACCCARCAARCRSPNADVCAVPAGPARH